VKTRPEAESSIAPGKKMKPAPAGTSVRRPRLIIDKARAQPEETVHDAPAIPVGSQGDVRAGTWRPRCRPFDSATDELDEWMAACPAADVLPPSR
jgi:hypothetical protein